MNKHKLKIPTNQNLKCFLSVNPTFGANSSFLSLLQTTPREKEDTACFSSWMVAGGAMMREEKSRGE